MNARIALVLAAAALACAGCTTRASRPADRGAQTVLGSVEYRRPNDAWRIVSVPRAERAPSGWSGRTVLAPDGEPLVLVRWIGHDAERDAHLFLARDRDTILRVLERLRALGHDVPADARDVRFHDVAPRETPDATWGSVWGCGGHVGFLTTVAQWGGGALSVAARRHGLDALPDLSGQLVLDVAPVDVRGRMRLARPARIPRDGCAIRPLGRVSWSDDEFVLHRDLAPGEAEDLVRLEVRARVAGEEGPPRHFAWVAGHAAAREQLGWALSESLSAHAALEVPRSARFTLSDGDRRVSFESPADANDHRRAKRCADRVLELLERELPDARDLRLVVQQD